MTRRSETCHKWLKDCQSHQGKAEIGMKTCLLNTGHFSLISYLYEDIEKIPNLIILFMFVVVSYNGGAALCLDWQGNRTQ